MLNFYDWDNRLSKTIDPDETEKFRSYKLAARTASHDNSNWIFNGTI